MSAIIDQAIRKSPLFKDLNEQWTKRLTRAASVHPFEVGEVIIEEGAEVTSLYIVLSGEVRVWSRIGERVVELETLGAGAYLGEVSLLSGKKATASVEALSENVGVLAIGRDILSELLAENSELRRVLEDTTMQRAKDTIGKGLS